MRLRLRFHKMDSDSGATHAALSLKDSVHYVENVFKDYQRVSGLTRFEGKMAELGPGDNAGVALMFLGNGVTQADLADRFYSHRQDDQHKKIYEALASKHPAVTPFLKEGVPDPLKIKRYYGEEAAGETFFHQNKGYDYIISRSVLEHVDDVHGVLQSMYAALNPQGLLIHKVDLRDHGMFTPFAYPLKFLEVPRWLYRLMTEGAGYPNRFLFHGYKKILTAINPKTRFYISGLHGVPELEQEYLLESLPDDLKQKSVRYINVHRHRFASEFKNVPAEDLMVSSFFFVCGKV